MMRPTCIMRPTQQPKGNAPPTRVSSIQPAHTSSLWAHLAFVRISGRRIGRRVDVVRGTVLVNGLFNQLFSLFTAVDLARVLGRGRLVVGNFYVQLNNKKDKVPASKVVDLASLLIPACDWVSGTEPAPSCAAKNAIGQPPDAVDRMRKESHIPDLEIGCCFGFPVPGHCQEEHIRRLRFHPVFYQLIAPFRAAHPNYQVVHYRMENDFTGYFHKEWGYSSLEESRRKLHFNYQEAMKARLDPSVPTLVVSHYYKDPAQQRDHDLQWPNLIHFSLSPAQRHALSAHLQLPHGTPMREVDAVLDFVLCDNTPVFIGCAGSTFSLAVCARHPNHSLVQPV